MSIVIRKLRKKDYHQVINFAIVGMHFQWYLDNPVLLRIYGRYFWYSELIRATQVIAAYEGDQLAGVLLARMKGDRRIKGMLWEKFYVKAFDVFQYTFDKGGAGVYAKTNRHMFSQYVREYGFPDGEILFFTANPRIKTKGIGSRILREFESKEIGKRVYLYTDTGCTYQFYEHRGFTRACERDVVLDMGKKKVPLKCLLYSKKIGGKEKKEK